MVRAADVPAPSRDRPGRLTVDTDTRCEHTSRAGRCPFLVTDGNSEGLCETHLTEHAEGRVV